MYVLYNLNSNAVIDLVDCLKIKGDYLLVDKQSIQVKYLKKNIGISFVPRENITCQTGVPMIFDGKFVVQKFDYT